MGSKLHLGCGSRYFQGWINIDLISNVADQMFDVLMPLTCASESVDFIFTEHLIEHFTREDCLSFLKECRRVLTLSGVMRISTPDLSWIASTYLNGADWSKFSWKPSSKGIFINDMFRKWEHRFLYDYGELVTIIGMAGFFSMRLVEWRQSDHPELRNLERRRYGKDLIVEIGKV